MYSTRSTLVWFASLILVSCNNYDDHKIIVDTSNSIRLNQEDTVLIGIKGEHELDYEVKMAYGRNLINSTHVTSDWKGEFTAFNVSLSTNEALAIELAEDIHSDREFNATLEFINEKNRKLLDTIVSVQVDLPPIIKVNRVEIINGHSFTAPSQLVDRVKQVEQRWPDKNSTEAYEVAFLSLLLQEGVNGIHNKTPQKSQHVFKPLEVVDVKLWVNKTYPKTFVGRYPNQYRTSYSDINLDRGLRESIFGLDTIETEATGVEGPDGFEVVDRVPARYNGIIGIYLIAFDSKDQYTFLEVGDITCDASAPKFKNSRYCSNSDAESFGEGIVCLDNEHFYGWSPFNVPFVGTAHGDIKKIVVDGYSVNFEAGKEFYFKKRVRLDGGYNRVSVDIYDNAGNHTESYIPITIQDMDDGDDIIIDNDVYIDN